ncbi:MAG: ATP-binding protein [Anaerolineales bacterium]
MREISLHLLDIAENSASAGAQNVNLQVLEDLRADRLWACVEDDGRGMSVEAARQALDPFYTSRSSRKVGLGLPLLKAAAEASNGGLTLTSALGQGTRLEVWFQHSHLDRMPLGDLGCTFLTLLVAHPQIHWQFSHRLIPPEGEDRHFSFDDRELKNELGEIPLTEPEVLTYLRGLFQL